MLRHVQECVQKSILGEEDLRRAKLLQQTAMVCLQFKIHRFADIPATCADLPDEFLLFAQRSHLLLQKPLPTIQLQHSLGSEILIGDTKEKQKSILNTICTSSLLELDPELKRRMHNTLSMVNKKRDALFNVGDYSSYIEFVRTSHLLSLADCKYTIDLVSNLTIVLAIFNFRDMLY